MAQVGAPPPSGATYRESIGLATDDPVTPSASMDAAYRRPQVTQGRTGEVGMLVTAAGADYALVASSWTNFHPGCAGLPGSVGNKATRTRGVAGVAGVKSALGQLSAQIYPLAKHAPSGKTHGHTHSAQCPPPHRAPFPRAHC